MKIGFVKSSFVSSTLRFSAGYHLSAAVQYEILIKAKDYKLLKDMKNSIFTSGRGKRCYTTKEFGIPFLGNNEITSFNPLMGCKHISKKFFDDENAFLKEGMILTGRVGQDTVGAYTYCNSFIENCVGSDNIIRILLKQQYDSGFVFAFLASKFGYALTRRYITGGAQPFVTENMISEIPVPVFKNKETKEIAKLISEAGVLRDNANKMLAEAQGVFYRNLGVTEKELFKLNVPLERGYKQAFQIESKSLNSKTFRARNYSPRKAAIIKLMSNGKFNKLSAVLKTPPYYGARYKRIESADRTGIELLSQGDIFMARPEGKFIATKSIKNIEDEIVQRGTILIPGQGTLGENEIFGRAIFVWGYLEKKLVAGHCMRFIPDESKISSGYLFTVLNSHLWFRILRDSVYGTNLLGFLVELIREYPIPRFSSEVETQIDELVKKAHKDLESSIEKEKFAIASIEKEIESWQK